MTDQVVSKEQQMVERFAQVFTKVNSVLTLRKTKVEVCNSPWHDAPAWSDAKTVTFNIAKMGDLTNISDLAWLKGLDLHEVAHILYTPRKGSELTQWVIDNGLFQAFNALEDMRIETLLVGRYPSITPWLQATIARYFLNNTDAFQYSYSLLRGRRYISAEIRAESRKAWHDQAQLKDLIDVIDAYRVLLFPRDIEVAKDLIQRYNDLMPKQDDPNGQDGDGEGQGQPKKVLVIKDPFGHGGRPLEGIDSSVSRPVPPREQERDQQSAERNSDKGDDIDLDDFDEVVFDDSDSDSDGSDSDDLGDDTDGDTDGSDSDSDGSDSATDSATDSAETSSPAEGVSAGTGISEKVATMLSNAIDEVLDNEQFATELENLVRQIKGLPTLGTVDVKAIRTAQYNELAVDGNTHASARAFGRELERIKASVDPSWERNVERGRINPLRYLRGDDIKTIYDRWDEGNADATDIECVIALDNSGSMSGDSASKAYQAMYAIKRALDKVNASTTVVTFNSVTEVLYASHEKAGTHLRDAGSTGGTVALEAIKYSTNILAESGRAVRLFFVITDGAWSDAQESDALITKMRNAGVLTAFAYIGRYCDSTHGCEISQTISNPTDLIQLGRKLVKTGIARRLTNA